MFVGPDHLDVRARQDRGLAAGTEEADQIPEIAAKTFFLHYDVFRFNICNLHDFFITFFDDLFHLYVNVHFG
jgi:hypothetical protein